MVALEDTAEELIALFTALGAVNQVNAIGTVTSTNSTLALPDPTVQAISTVTLSASGDTFQLPAPGTGKKLRLLITQDSTGSRTCSFSTSSGGLQWVGAAAPTLTTTGGRSDLLEFECFDGTNFVGSSKLNVH